MKTWFTLFATLLTLTVHSQDSLSNITDLAAMKSTRTLPKGKWLINTDFNYSVINRLAYCSDCSYSELMNYYQVGYGINNWWDVRLSAGYSAFNVKVNSERYTSSYWNDVQVQSRFSITEQDNWIPELAGNVNLIMYDLDYMEVVLSMMLKYRFFKKAHFAGQFDYVPTEGDLTPYYSLRVGYDMSLKTGLQVGFNSGYHPYFPFYSDNSILLGGSHNILPNLQVTAYYFTNIPINSNVNVNGIRITGNWLIGKGR